LAAASLAAGLVPVRGDTAPNALHWPVVLGALWIDTSGSPPVLKTFKDGRWHGVEGAEVLEKGGDLVISIADEDVHLRMTT
jgi:hypothetical protein